TTCDSTLGSRARHTESPESPAASNASSTATAARATPARGRRAEDTGSTQRPTSRASASSATHRATPRSCDVWSGRSCTTPAVGVLDSSTAWASAGPAASRVAASSAATPAASRTELHDRDFDGEDNHVGADLGGGVTVGEVVGGVVVVLEMQHREDLGGRRQ